jgi:hypothetical protein
MPTLQKEVRTDIRQQVSSVRKETPRIQPRTFFVRFKLDGHWLCEPFVMPLSYILGLKPHSVRGEMGELYVWNYKITKMGDRLAV